ncbi:hypothetical protein PybrP1_005750 [[Pythium] brassicae (nom. inval.)]|nr:hypothetical protein PybrP1_005750 [[Pythium] brassicae (nom. inval.)]
MVVAMIFDSQNCSPIFDNTRATLQTLCPLLPNILGCHGAAREQPRVVGRGRIPRATFAFPRATPASAVAVSLVSFVCIRSVGMPAGPALEQTLHGAAA